MLNIGYDLSQEKKDVHTEIDDAIVEGKCHASAITVAEIAVIGDDTNKKNEATMALQKIKNLRTHGNIGKAEPS